MNWNNEQRKNSEGDPSLMDVVSRALRRCEPRETDFDMDRIERTVLERIEKKSGLSGRRSWSGYVAKPAFAALVLGFSVFAGIAGLALVKPEVLQFIIGQVPSDTVEPASIEPLIKPISVPIDSSVIPSIALPQDTVSWSATGQEKPSPVIEQTVMTTDSVSSSPVDTLIVQPVSVPMAAVADELLGTKSQPANKARAVRSPSVSILRIPLVSGAESIVEQELGRVVQFVVRETGLTFDADRPMITLDGVYRNFDYWLRTMKRNPRPDTRGISPKEPEQSALEMLGSAASFLNERDVLGYQSRLLTTLTEYLRARFGISVSDQESLVKQIESAGVTLASWERQFLHRADSSYRTAVAAKKPSGKELYGMYQMLRINQIMSRSLLLCEPAGVPASISSENMELLQVYVNYGGLLYVGNVSGMDRCQGVRDLFRLILDEKVADSLGEKTLARMRREDRMVTGFYFDPPRPRIFHPSTLLPMTIPVTSTIDITIFDRTGKSVFWDTLRNVPEGQYTQRFKDYRLHAVDRTGWELPSGFYIYRAEAALNRTTHSFFISRVRRLHNGRHPVFTSQFRIREVPTARRVEPEDLPYGESGVFGVDFGGRLGILYTEGYGEMDLLIPTGSRDDQREALFRWMANVFRYALVSSEHQGNRN